MRTVEQIFVTASVVALNLGLLGGVSPASAQQIYEFDVPRGDLATVVTRIARAAGTPIAFPAGLATDRVAGPIKGRASVTVALSQALAGTSLVATPGPGGSLIIRSAAPPATTSTAVQGDLAVIDVTDVAGNSYGDVGFVAGDAGPATRIDAPLKEIPLSISAVTSEAIKSQNITTVADAARNVAGLTYTPGDIGPPLYNIRGFQSVSASINGAPGGGLTTVPIDDIERIEVLKGPTSVLTGTSAQGGIVNITTKAPTDQVIRDATVRFGHYGYRTLAFDFGGPVEDLDGVTYRLNMSGNQANQTYAGYRDPHEYLVSPSVRWKTDDTSLTVGLRYVDTQTSQPPQTTFDPDTGKLINTRRRLPLGGPDFHGNATGLDLYSQFSHDFGTVFGFETSFNNKVQKTSQSGNFNLTQLSNYELPRNFSVYTYNFKYDYNILTEQADFTLKRDFGFMKQTLRFGFDYIDSQQNYGAQYGETSSIDIYSGLPRLAPAEPAFSSKTQLTSRFRTPGFSFIDKVDTLDNRLHIFGMVRQDYFGSYTRDRFGDTARAGQWGLSWAAGGAFDVAPWLTAFGNLSAGFVPQTGVDVSTGAALPPQGQEQQETGLRLFLFDKRLTLSATAYEQVNTNFAVPVQGIDGVGSSVLVPAQSTKGFEYEATGEILPGWNVIAAFTDRKTDYPSPLLSSIVIPGVPKIVSSLWSTYSIQSGPLQGLYFGAGVQTQTKSVFVSYMFATNPVIPGYETFNAAIGYKQDAFDINLKLNNITDKKYYFSQGAGTVVYLAQGFNALLQARYSF